LLREPTLYLQSTSVTSNILRLWFRLPGEELAVTATGLGRISLRLVRSHSVKIR